MNDSSEPNEDTQRIIISQPRMAGKKYQMLQRLRQMLAEGSIALPQINQKWHEELRRYGIPDNHDDK